MTGLIPEHIAYCKARKWSTRQIAESIGLHGKHLSWAQIARVLEKRMLKAWREADRKAGRITA